MTACILPFPKRQIGSRGIVHVMGDSVDGFYVSHESASGNSWGALYGPFRSGQEAITQAFALNRDQYEGTCAVAIYDAAAQDAHPGAGPHSWPGEF